MPTLARARGDKSSRATIDARRLRVLQAVAARHSPATIMATEAISRATFWRDLEAIGEDYAGWGSDEKNVALQLAIANYQYVIKTAKADHDWEKDNEGKWLRGAFDHTGFLPEEDGGTKIERKPVNYRTNKHNYLQVVINASKELVKLAGLEAAQRIDVRATVEATVTHEIEDLDDAFNRITDPAERAAFIERVRAADEAARAAEAAFAVLGLPAET